MYNLAKKAATFSLVMPDWFFSLLCPFPDSSGLLFNKSKWELIQCPGGYSGSYIVPDSVTTIDDRAFAYCKELTYLTIPNSVNTIGRDAFLFCDNLTIYCFSGSTAESYAKQKSIPYILLDSEG